jgi:1-acyl-sn-glycerol-3-phosphate acyltransferase
MSENEAWLDLGGGAAVGSLIAALLRHPRRTLGLVPFGLTVLTGVLALMAFTETGGPGILFLFAGAAILTGIPLFRAVLHPTPYGGPGKLVTVLFLGWLLGLLMVPAPLAALAVAAGAGAALAWSVLFPQALELTVEILLWPVYRIRVRGSGAGQIPRYGPLLVVANHAAYMDPFWIAKIVPRHVTPMMTSVFFDRPLIHWLMVHVVGAIRVEATYLRREAPELGEAVAVLRRGGCVLVFPEASLRRTEQQLIRPFGQGVWHILHELPDIPVLVCWIEGGWGSYTSYFNGPPMEHKRPHWRHPIDIGVDEPRSLDAAVLIDHRTTRTYLMRACAACRRFLGLPVPDDTGHLSGLDRPSPGKANPIDP